MSLVVQSEAIDEGDLARPLPDGVVVYFLQVVAISQLDDFLVVDVLLRGEYAALAKCVLIFQEHVCLSLILASHHLDQAAVGQHIHA